QPLLFSDDDVHCRFGVLRDPEPNAVAFGPCDETIDFFADRAAVLGAIAPRTVDVLALHGRFLGKDLGQLARGEPVGLDEVTSRMLRPLLAGRGRVVMTMPGLFGDCAVDGPESLMMLPRMARGSMLGSERAYRLAVRTREVVRAARRATVEHPVLCAATF